MSSGIGFIAVYYTIFRRERSDYLMITAKPGFFQTTLPQTPSTSCEMSFAATNSANVIQKNAAGGTGKRCLTA